MVRKVEASRSITQHLCTALCGHSPLPFWVPGKQAQEFGSWTNLTVSPCIYCIYKAGSLASPLPYLPTRSILPLPHSHLAMPETPILPDGTYRFGYFTIWSEPGEVYLPLRWSLELAFWIPLHRWCLLPNVGRVRTDKDRWWILLFATTNYIPNNVTVVVLFDCRSDLKSQPEDDLTETQVAGSFTDYWYELMGTYLYGCSVESEVGWSRARLYDLQQIDRAICYT